MDNKNQKGDSDKNNKNKKNNKQGFSVIIMTTLITVCLILFMYKFMDNTTSEEIPYNEFIDMIDDKTIEKVVIDSVKGRIHITPKKEEDNQVVSTYYTIMIPDPKLAERLEEADKKDELEFKGTLESSNSNMFLSIISMIFPFLLMMVIFNVLFRKMGKGGGIMGVGKNNAKL